jgi:hypothetical protein
MSNKDNLSTIEAARYLGLSISFLNKLRSGGGGPRYAKVGRRVIYPRVDLDLWLASRERQSTSDAGCLQP